jgi:hypothetical protein
MASEFDLKKLEIQNGNPETAKEQMRILRSQRVRAYGAFGLSVLGRQRAEEGVRIQRQIQIRRDEFAARRLLMNDARALLEQVANNVNNVNNANNANNNANANIANPLDRLTQIARDTQSVHTREVVELVKRNVQRILLVPVPPEYSWNDKVLSKTPGEIIAECKLSLHAGCQMLTHYCSPISVYELVPGIYGKVLDAVWQFLKASDSFEELKKIMKQELEDNIGMCAQGNLTRIANIVNGLLEGLEQQENYKQVLGRLLPKLLFLPMDERLKRARLLFEDYGVPEAEWGEWLDELL